MPKIAEFAGIVVAMYFADHNPPHFHATYGEHEAALAIGAGAVLAGWLPAKQLKRVQAWAAENEALLRAKWDELH
jgi:hypothetical protein